MSPSDKRKNPRFAGEIPVTVMLGEVVASESAYLNDISVGGISFDSMVALVPGTVIILQVPPGKPVFGTAGRVVWCRKLPFQYQIGVEFLDVDMAFRNALVEMVRRIEEYRQAAARDGRNLTGQEATLEWISLHGEDFFRPNGPPKV